MRRDLKEIEVAESPQVDNDPVLKGNQLYHSCVRDVKSRGLLSATFFSLERVGMRRGLNC